MSKHNVGKLKAEIKVTENLHRAEKNELRETQRKVSEHDRRPEKDQSWKERSKLCDGIGSLISSVAAGKETLTRLYMARASLRGRLHLSKRIVHHSNGAKEVENWTLESQARFVEDALVDYLLPEVKAEEANKPAA